MFQAVVFDLDGTLLDTLRDLANAGNHALHTLGFAPHAEADYKRMVGNGLAKLVERMLPPGARSEENLAKASAAFSDYYSQHLRDHTAPYEGIAPMLSSLHSQSTNLAVLSNKPDEYTKNIVNTYFNDVFDAIIGLAEPYLPKPNPGLLEQVIHSLGATPQTTLYCGDSDVDMEVARRAGAVSCGVLWGFRGREELMRAGAAYLAEVPSDILDFARRG